MQPIAPNRFFQTLRCLFDKVHASFRAESHSCLYCQKNGPASTLPQLCEACYSRIPWIYRVQCSVCGRYEDCYDCVRRNKTYFEYNRSAVQYNDMMREMLAMYKYRGSEKLAPLFVEILSAAYDRLLSECVSVNPQHRFDYIVYTPISRMRLEERGFNQAEQMARGIGDKYRLPVLPLLRRKRHTDKQSYKARSLRLSDLEDVFEVDYSVITTQDIPAHRSKSLDIILVDDIYTTGSTLNQCAKAVLSHMNARIYGLTWAR